MGIIISIFIRIFEAQSNEQGVEVGLDTVSLTSEPVSIVITNDVKERGRRKERVHPQWHALWSFSPFSLVLGKRKPVSSVFCTLPWGKTTDWIPRMALSNHFQDLGQFEWGNKWGFGHTTLCLYFWPEIRPCVLAFTLSFIPPGILPCRVSCDFASGEMGNIQGHLSNLCPQRRF